MAILMSHDILQYCKCCQKIEISTNLQIGNQSQYFRSSTRYLQSWSIIVSHRAYFKFNPSINMDLQTGYVSKMSSCAQRLQLNTMRNSICHSGYWAWACARRSIPSTIVSWCVHYDWKDFQNNVYLYYQYCTWFRRPPWIEAPSFKSKGEWSREIHEVQFYLIVT